MKFHEYVSIALWPEIIAQHRTERCQFTNVMSLSESVMPVAGLSMVTGCSDTVVLNSIPTTSNSPRLEPECRRVRARVRASGERAALAIDEDGVCVAHEVFERTDDLDIVAAAF